MTTDFKRNSSGRTQIYEYSPPQLTHLKCGNCNNRLKLILVTCEQFCLAKRCPICYKIDFQNTSHVVAFIAVAQGTL